MTTGSRRPTITPSRRFSGLSEITVDRVSHCARSGYFPPASSLGTKAAPLIVNGTMFVVTPFPGRVRRFGQMALRRDPVGAERCDA